MNEKNMKKRILSILLAAIMIFSLLPVSAFAGSVVGARSYSDENGNVFLCGNYIEVGVCKTGIFGTTAAPQSDKGFHFVDGKESSGAYLGLLADGDGWNSGDDPITGDFFTPGTPEERWVLGYKIDGAAKVYAASGRSSVSGVNNLTVANTSDTTKGTLSATVTGTTVDGVAFSITYKFGVDDLEYTTDVTVTNNSGKKITDVRFMRSFDPDQDQWYHSSYDTYNKVICNPDSAKDGGGKNYAMVVARGAKTGAGVFFLSFDNRANAYMNNYGVFPSDIFDYVKSTNPAKTSAEESDIRWDSANTNGYLCIDAAIQLITFMGDIENSASDNTTYFTSLDPDVMRSVSKVVNSAVDYVNEKLVGFEPHTVYIFEYEEGGEKKTHTITSDENGEIPLSGQDNDEKQYNFIGKKIKITEDGSEEEPQELDVAGRPTPQDPDVPTNTPSDIDANDVETTTNSIKVKAVDGQEYRIGTDGPWKSPDEDGYVTFSGLDQLTEYTIYTRVKATSSIISFK